MSKIQPVSTESAPAALGAYSQAVKSSNLVFCSGQVGLDPRTGEFVAGGVQEQTRQVLENLQSVLQAAGTDLAHALKLTVFLKDMNDFGAMNTVYATFFRADQAPARAAVEVARLPKDALVEIDCIAALPPAQHS